MKKQVFLFVILLFCGSAQNCLNCQSGACTAQGCTRCNDGFLLSSRGWCGIFTPVEGCRTYDELLNRCASCDADRELVDLRCLKKPDNCEIADRFRECLKCQANFQLQKGQCLTKNIANCPEGSLPVNGFCQPTRAQNCRNLNQQKICTSCDPNYTLMNGRCLRIISSQACPSASCACPNDFFLFGQVCYQIQIDRCTVKSSAVYCYACQRGFVAIDGICLEPVKQDDVNCNVLAPLSDYCTGCNQDYFLNIDAFCYRNFNLTNCPVASGYFYPENDKCLYRDRRCVSVDFRNNSYVCLRCQEGHILSPQGFCERDICIRYSENRTCIEAFIGYIITGPNQFFRLPKNCLAVDSAGRCTQCSIYTASKPLLPTESVCAYVDPNCAAYNSNGSCISCINENDPNGYVLRERFCFKKAENCLRRDRDQSKCLECGAGYHLDQVDKRCYINVAGCEVYLTGSDCKQCALSGYLLYRKNCYPVNLDCLDYDANNLCRRCSQGLMPFRNICVFYHPYCLAYGADRVCSRAASGWALGTGMTEDQKIYYRSFMARGEQVTNIRGVVNLNGLPAISAAAAGAYSSGAFITRFPYANVLHTKISSVNAFGQITACNQGLTLINNACIFRVVANCELYSQDEICLRCAPNFTLQGDFTCVQGLQCASPQDVSNGRCIKCASGTIMMGVQCFVFASRTLVDQQLQSSIFYRYTFGDGSYMAWPRLSNCNRQVNPVQCAECAAGYQLVNGLCIIPIERCIDYGFGRGQNPGICQACQAGFSLWLGQCRRLVCTSVASGMCQVCNANYYYYFGLCLMTAQNGCRIYENNFCALCNSGFYLNTQNQCQAQVSGCLTTNRDTGRCLECRSGMTLYRQRCVIYIPYCDDYSNDNKCINCQQNTVNRTQLLRDGTCAFLEGQCARVDEAKRQCAQCNLGYSLITQDGRLLCVNVRQNCRTYDSRGRCIICNPLYILRNNACVRFISNCVTLSPDQQTCIQCTRGTGLDGGCCKIPDPNCINYNQCICTGCMTQFHLNDSGLCQPNINGCDIYDKATRRCIKCSTLFYLMSDGTCLHRDIVTNGCENGFNLTQINGYRCLKCIQGFILNSQGLCEGYNCPGMMALSRYCINCPPYYRIFRGSPTNELLNYCIPYFCESYIPDQAFCTKNETFYNGGHIIIVINRTITIQYCQSIDPTTKKCTSCTNFRYPSTSTLYNLCYPLHCASTTQFDCLQCQFGYGADSRFPGSCLPLFCSAYKEDGTCSACVAPYTLSSTGICENKGCCDIYDSTLGVCRTAKKYYFLQNSVCIPVNCIKYDPNQLTICLQCALGYTLLPDGTCRVSNCQTDDRLNGESCQVCNRGFKQTYVPATTKTICLPRYCQEIAAEYGSCIRCADGFTLNQDKLCQADYCNSYLPSLVCQRCIPYFRLNQNEQCVADCAIGNTTKCQCCTFGNMINLNTSLCQPRSEFCLAKTSNGFTCRQCVAGYILKDGECFAPVANCRIPSAMGCVSCNVGFEVIDNCRCAPKYCVTTAPNGLCAVCHPRFELTPEGLCRARDCKTFSVQNWVCNDCYSRFRFVDGICVTNDCAQWKDFQNTTCMVCAVSQTTSNLDFSRIVPLEFNLTNGACYIKFCKVDPRDYYCKECIPGYNVTMNGLCECIRFDSITNKCICPEGYIYNDAFAGCEFNRDVCLQRDSKTGLCIQCPYRYMDPSTTSGQCVPLYCQAWELVAPRYIQCRKCLINFILKDGFCESSLCLKFETRTGLLLPQCTQCQSGYSPYLNFCVPLHCQPATYNLQTGICTNCSDFGYILSPDRTRCIVANCQVQLLPDLCSKCKFGYYNFTQLCIASNCTVFDQVTCIGCVAGFTLRNGLCYADNCASYGNNNFCLSCASGFVLVGNFTCVREFCLYDSKDRCLQCKRGYTFSPTLLRCVAINCQKYRDNRYQFCQTCLPGYSFQNGTCIDIFCAFDAFTPDYKCTQCLPGFTLNSDGLCRFNSFCPAGRYYSISDGACVPIPVPDCRFYNGSYCFGCADSFFLYNGLCYSIRFCTKYSYYFGCSECVADYILSNRQCVPRQGDPNCLQYSPSIAQQCVRCKAGYQLIYGKCIMVPQNCLEVDANGRCIRCSPGFNFNQTSNMCETSDSNCLYFNSAGGCAQCRDGFYLNAQGRCQMRTVLPNCANSDGNGRCLICNPGYYLQNGRCYLQYQYCVRYSETTEKCVECLTNFTLIGPQCICPADSQIISNKFCIRLPTNCLQISPINYFCVRCINGYRLTSDFRCVLIPNPPDNCSIYDPATGICSKCFPPFYLSDNRCLACQVGSTLVGDRCVVIIPGCKDYTVTGICQQCLDNYRLENGRCFPNKVPLMCEVYNATSLICEKCLAGYILSPNGQQCTINNCLTHSLDYRTCLKCIDTFSWVNGQCRYDTEWCISYFNGRCVSCLSFASLNQFRCVPNFCTFYDYINGFCRTCRDGYQLIDRRCYTIINGCSGYFSNGTCQVCLPGYLLINGLCEYQTPSIPPFCSSYNATTATCVTCLPGYTLTSDAKRCVLTNCDSMDPTGTICNRCLSPFSWDGRACVFRTDFCLSYTNGYCSSCPSFSLLQRNRCVPNFCSNYNYNVGVCESCNTGYILSATVKRCFLIIQWCLAYSDQGLCLQCQNGYTLSSNGLSCSSVSVPACYAQSGSVCNRCQYRYYLSSQMCSAYLPYCINIDPLGNCISCCFGSTLVRGSCQRDTSIKYCARQVGNVCQECLPNYNYCSFCQTCLPSSPNCNRYSGAGDCLECSDNFLLLNGVCVSVPVGYVSGALGTCRSGYYPKDGNCYRNNNELRLFSQSRSNVPVSSVDYYAVKVSSDPLIIFSILIKTQSSLSANSSFILYYRSKINDPFVCWNSCIPTRIDYQNFAKDLVHPIIAYEINLYLVGLSLQNTAIDFRIL